MAVKLKGHFYVGQEIFFMDSRYIHLPKCINVSSIELSIE